MIKLTFKQLAKILSFKGDIPAGGFCGVSTDTRTLEPGNLFVGLKGDRGIDGSEFVSPAIKKGASAALVNETAVDSGATDWVRDDKLWKVPDTIKALGQLATYWRNQFELPIIAITGSNGKTTIKNMVGAILQQACQDQIEQVLISHSSFNNPIGVPLSLFRLNQQHKCAVLEMGMSHFGEIAYLSRMVRPNIAVISNALSSHLKGVGDLDGVAKAKAEIFTGLESNKFQKSYAILNADDHYFNYWIKQAKNHEVISFSIENPSNIMARDLQLYPDYSQFIVCAKSGDITIKISLPGKHNVMNALAAISACLSMKIDLQIIKKGLEQVAAADNRLQVVTTKEGACILNDCYNANPASLRAAIDVLVTYAGKKILVLGDMKELGAQEEALHAEMGQYAAQAGVDEVLAIGKLSKHFVTAFNQNARHFDTKEDLIEYLRTFLAKGTTILIKGSRSMQLEEVIEKVLD